jgi:hypothetical protein
VDNTRVGEFWLVRDYLPEFIALSNGRPTLAERAAAIGALGFSSPADDESLA